MSVCECICRPRSSLVCAKVSREKLTQRTQSLWVQGSQAECPKALLFSNTRTHAYTHEHACTHAHKQQPPLYTHTQEDTNFITEIVTQITCYTPAQLVCERPEPSWVPKVWSLVVSKRRCSFFRGQNPVGPLGRTASGPSCFPKSRSPVGL